MGNEEVFDGDGITFEGSFATAGSSPETLDWLAAVQDLKGIAFASGTVAARIIVGKLAGVAFQYADTFLRAGRV